MIWEIRLVLNKPGILTHGSVLMPEGEDVNMQTVVFAEENSVVVPLGSFLPEESLGVLSAPAVRGSQEPLDVGHVRLVDAYLQLRGPGQDVSPERTNDLKFI